MQNKFSLNKKSFDILEVFWNNKLMGEFVRNLDGFFIFYPETFEKGDYSDGGQSQIFLKCLLENLENLNKSWKDNVDLFFPKKHIAQQFELPL
jgi:hypothetical protein